MPVARNTIVYNISNGARSATNVVTDVNSVIKSFSYCDSAGGESTRGINAGYGPAPSYGDGNQNNYNYNNDDNSSDYDSAERNAEIERKDTEWNAKQYNAGTNYNYADSWNNSSNSAGCGSDGYRECQYKVNPYHKCNQYCDHDNISNDQIECLILTREVQNAITNANGKIVNPGTFLVKKAECQYKVNPYRDILPPSNCKATMMGASKISERLSQNGSCFTGLTNANTSTGTSPVSLGVGKDYSGTKKKSSIFAKGEVP